jgi:hypothetical protein
MTESDKSVSFLFTLKLKGGIGKCGDRRVKYDELYNMVPVVCWLMWLMWLSVCVCVCVCVLRGDLEFYLSFLWSNADVLVVLCHSLRQAPVDSQED